jgi:iron-sulfur cluster assembly accessory protein
MITMTPVAVKEVKALIEKDGRDDAMLRVGVEGGGCSGLNYTMNLDTVVDDLDQQFEFEGISVVCHAKSYLYLNGMNIDYTQDMLGGGFKFENPNASRSCGCGTSFSV